VAGIGNVFLTDDAFGSEAARRLLAEPRPEGVSVVDYGIRGMHLAFDLVEGYDALVILDAMPRGGAPGDVTVLEVGEEDLGDGEFDAHGMNPTSVLASLGTLGGRLPRTFVVGCEPGDVGEGIGMTPAVAGAVDRALAAVRELITELVAELATGLGTEPTPEPAAGLVAEQPEENPGERLHPIPETPRERSVT
jgi:hydrogenase maturation protease